MFHSLKFFMFWISVLASFSCKPISDFHEEPDYSIIDISEISSPAHNDILKIVIFKADHHSTEIFDLLSPYYLFSSSQNANVLLIEKVVLPIKMFRPLMILAYHTFESFIDLGLNFDLIVISNVSNVKKNKTNQEILDFICLKYQEDKTAVFYVGDNAEGASPPKLLVGYGITCCISNFNIVKKVWTKLKSIW